MAKTKTRRTSTATLVPTRLYVDDSDDGMHTPADAHAPTGAPVAAIAKVPSAMDLDNHHDTDADMSAPATPTARSAGIQSDRRRPTTGAAERTFAQINQ